MSHFGSLPVFMLIFEGHLKGHSFKTSKFGFVCKECRAVLKMAEDIYTAVGWESIYQNGYFHGSHSRGSTKSAIYMAAGCQHKIAIYKAALPEPIRYTYTRLPYIHIQSIFTRPPFKSQIGYRHC